MSDGESTHERQKRLEKRRPKERRWYATWRTTRNGLMRRMYKTMKRRCDGKNRDRPQYRGMYYPSGEDFFAWILGPMAERFEELYLDWMGHEFDLKHRPTPDRRDPNVGYEFQNMFLNTYSENTRRMRKQNTRGKQAA